MKHAQPGTVSHGTLRTRDLLDTFASALEALQQLNLYTSDGDERELVALNYCVTEALAEHERLAPHVGLTTEVHDLSDTLNWLLDDMVNLLERFAPPGHYFGTHPGDGSDFGYWPSDDD